MFGTVKFSALNSFFICVKLRAYFIESTGSSLATGEKYRIIYLELLHIMF